MYTYSLLYQVCKASVSVIFQHKRAIPSTDLPPVPPSCHGGHVNTINALTWSRSLTRCLALHVCVLNDLLLTLPLSLLPNCVCACVCVCCCLTQGTTVENICSELRYLPDTRSLAQDHALVLLCDLSHSTSDAVEVAIVSGPAHSAPLITLPSDVCGCELIGHSHSGLESISFEDKTYNFLLTPTVSFMYCCCNPLYCLSNSVSSII